MASPAAASLSLLLYDNKYTGAIKRTDLLYRSATLRGVPFEVGSLLPASERPWMAGDREEWLLRKLPGVKSALTILLDATDAVLFCSAAELTAKWHALAGIGSNGRGRVLVGVEQQLWPEEQFYSFGSAKRKADYPRAPIGHASGKPGKSMPGTPFRYINIGMLAGRPADVHGMLRCMQERYGGFPRQCPGGRRSNGSYEFFSNAPHRTRFGIFSGHWGWEQSCFHTYLYEQAHGHLPAHCPELALDYRADVILNLKKTVEQLQLGWATAGERPRINHTWLPSLRDVRPCVVHANSATKSIMPILQLFLERVHLPFANAPDNAAASSKPGELVGIRAPTERDVAMVVDAWHEELMEKTLNPCIIGARTIPGLGANEARVHHACTSFKQKYMQQFIAKHHRRPLG
jgi:hypothetical protein